jgi:hypothetical protein
MSTSRYQSELENRKLPPHTCRAGEQTTNVMGPGEIKGGSVQSSGFHHAVAAGKKKKKKKKQNDMNHTQMGIGHGHTPAEQDEGAQRDVPVDGKRRIEEKDHANATAVAGQLCMRYASKGLLAAGNPVSNPAFQTTYDDGCATRLCHLMDELLSLLLGDQDRWLVLYSSLQKHVAHLPWGCMWEPRGRAHREQSRLHLYCTCTAPVLHLCYHSAAPPRRPDLNGPQTAQLTLPLHHGSLGQVHTGQEEGDTAYQYTAATTQQAMCNRSADFRSSNGPDSARLHPQCEALHDKADTMCRPESRVVSKDSMRHHRGGAEHLLPAFRPSLC